MAFRGGLVADLGNHLTIYFSEQHSRMAVREVINAAPANSEFYVCGPTRLVDDAVASATALQILLDRMHTERFSAPQGLPNKPIDAELKRSKKIVRVNADQTILDAAQASGLDALADCRIGSCGTCSVKVLEGTPEHRDSALTDSERVRAQLMCICVSRAESKRLVLDL